MEKAAASNSDKSNMKVMPPPADLECVDEKKKNTEDRNKKKSSNPSKISIMKNVQDDIDILTSPVKKNKKKEKEVTSSKLRHSPCLSSAKVQQKESLSSEETENPLANAFKRLDWSKIMPKSNGCYTLYVGQTPVTVTVRTEDLPVGHSSPKALTVTMI